MSQRVVLFFRKKREAANFSIERSFAETQNAFEQLDFPKPEWYNLSHYSIGLLPRLRAMLEARQHQGDVNHITGDVNFLVLALPGKKTVLTLLDCGFLKHPNPIIRRILKLLWLDLPVKHAHYITAISESTKQDVIRHTGCRPDKIRVIPVVITSDFKPVVKPFNTSKPQILHIGTAFNKNLVRHIEAISGLNCTLHIIGKIPDAERMLLEQHSIDYTNEFDVSAERVFEAYAQCDMLLFASTLEGFGMPILEAQMIGRPVVTGNVTSMPEVAGKGACLVDPFDAQNIRAGILKVWQDDHWRSQLIEAGFENVKRYEPLTVAAQYADLYQEILMNNTR